LWVGVKVALSVDALVDALAGEMVDPWVDVRVDPWVDE